MSKTSTGIKDIIFTAFTSVLPYTLSIQANAENNYESLSERFDCH